MKRNAIAPILSASSATALASKTVPFATKMPAVAPIARILKNFKKKSKRPDKKYQTSIRTLLMKDSLKSQKEK